MAYTERQNKTNQKYVREHQKQIMVKYRKDVYAENIEPFVKASGLPVATFIKEAVAEKIDRDFPNGL